VAGKNCLLDPLGCLTSAAGGGVSDAATSAWDSVCKSFADAAAELLKAFGQAFAALPSLNLESAGISSTYGISLAIAATVAALLVFAGVIRTAWTHDGSGIAQAVTGVGKALLAWLLTAAVATASLQASDEITRLVVNQSFGSQQALADRLGTIVNWAEVTGDPGQAILGGSLLLVFALIGIALVIVLWFELLLRNAAIAVLVATSPIAAAGQASEATKAWWVRGASATAQLIILKPVIALVFAVGFGMAGTSDGVESLLEGLLVLALAAFSWPVIARFFTFGSVQASSSGLATALGFLAGQASQSGGRGTAGVNPGQWSMAAENRTMAGRGEGAGTLPGAAGGGAGGGNAAASGGGSGAAALAGIGFALQKAHQAGTALSGADGADRRARRHAGRLPVLHRLRGPASRTRGRLWQRTWQPVPRRRAGIARPRCAARLGCRGRGRAPRGFAGRRAGCAARLVRLRRRRVDERGNGRRPAYLRRLAAGEGCFPVRLQRPSVGHALRCCPGRHHPGCHDGHAGGGPAVALRGCPSGGGSGPGRRPYR
jgi:hypothetical protein